MDVGHRADALGLGCEEGRAPCDAEHYTQIHQLGELLFPLGGREEKREGALTGWDRNLGFRRLGLACSLGCLSFPISASVVERQE